MSDKNEAELKLMAQAALLGSELERRLAVSILLRAAIAGSRKVDMRERLAALQDQWTSGHPSDALHARIVALRAELETA